jgi:hypothetical protein
MGHNIIRVSTLVVPWPYIKTTESHVVHSTAPIARTDVSQHVRPLAHVNTDGHLTGLTQTVLSLYAYY